MSTTAEALAPQTDAPVSPTAPAQPDGAERETGNEADPSSAAPAKPSDNLEPEAKGIQRRFDELTKARREEERQRQQAERDRDHWRDMATRMQPPAPKLPEVEKPKTLADFGFDETQHQAYLLQQASRAATEAAKAELKADQERQAEQRRAETYVQRVKAFAKDKPDFREVAEIVGRELPEALAKTVIELEAGPEIVDYLGRNREALSQIRQLPPNIAAYEMGQIAARLKYERETVAKAKALVSEAPAPAAKIGAGDPGTGSIKADDPTSDKLTDDEWLRKRNKQVAAKRGT